MEVCNMAYIDSVRKSLLQGAMTQAQLLEEASLYLEFGYITQDEYNEVVSLINAHFGA